MRSTTPSTRETAEAAFARSPDRAASDFAALYDSGKSETRNRPNRGLEGVYGARGARQRGF
jgi:hypothetical protein